MLTAPTRYVELRETEDVVTANAMLKDGWLLLEIASIKRGPLYVFGKQRNSESAEVMNALPQPIKMLPAQQNISGEKRP